MRPGMPLAELPDHLTFALDEVARILFVVDVAVESTAPRSSDRDAARTVQRLITANGALVA
ncbi:hypothetical protein BH24ACT14_BH24ACT14_02110 [soil metagenome]